MALLIFNSVCYPSEGEYENDGHILTSKGTAWRHEIALAPAEQPVAANKRAKGLPGLS